MRRYYPYRTAFYIAYRRSLETYLTPSHAADVARVGKRALRDLRVDALVRWARDDACRTLGVPMGDDAIIAYITMQ